MIQGQSEQKTHEPRQWQHLALSGLLALMCGFCMLKYLGYAWVYSGNYGMPSHADLVLSARRWGLTYLSVGLLAEAALITNLALNLRFDNTELSVITKPVARVLGALVTAALGTLGTAFLLSWVGRLLH